MDEPFTGLDPVNLTILREAFLELRDEGRDDLFDRRSRPPRRCELRPSSITAGSSRPAPWVS